ncbi:MAG: DMT family transporter [Proteobacteria bacterium]|nr:DMT family transporter [Pseudomonadota bacterium]
MRRCRTAACGILWMVSAQLLFAASWAVIKTLGRSLPVMELVFFRGLASVIIITSYMKLRGMSLRGQNHTALFLRALFGFVAMALSFYSMTKMKIGDASTLFNTLPIFVALLAPAFLGERFSLGKLALVVVAFGGIGLILKPDTSLFEGAAAYALMAGFLGALAMLCVRRMAASDSSLVITLYFTGFTALCSAPFAFSRFKAPTLEQWGLIAFIGVALTFGQILMVHAYKLGNASTIAPFSYASVIAAYFLGLLLFSEVPDLWSAMGAALVVGSGIGIMFTAPTTEEREEMRSAKVT